MAGDNRAKLILVIITLPGIAFCFMPFFINPPGILELHFTDPIFHSGLEGKSVSITLGSTGVGHQTSIQRSDEIYLVRIPDVPSDESLNFTVEVEGYRQASVTLSIPPMAVGQADIQLQPVFGRIKISAIDGYTNRPLSNFSCRIQEKTGKKMDDGSVIFDLAPGSYTMEVTADGFCSGSIPVESIEGEIRPYRANLSPELNHRELARIMLEWDENPRDLDAHLILPKNAGLKTTHVYYNNKTSSKVSNNRLAASLDVDHQNSEGVETITIYKTVKGRFLYGVKKYAGRGTLGSSNAKVTVVTDRCQTRVFRVIPNCRQEFWEILYLDYNGNEVKIIPINKCKKMGWASREKS